MILVYAQFFLLFYLNFNFNKNARYHNIMGMETISVLCLLTTSITEVITHPTMADR